MLARELPASRYDGRCKRAVCRINVPDVVGNGSEWGTSFLVGPRLLLTNNHVFPTPEDALMATVEFGYELDSDGRLRRGTRFRLTPQEGFVASPMGALDYTLVTIADRSDDGATALSDLGFFRLAPRAAKIEEGQYATIIQHPDACTKRVCLRENKVVKSGDEQNSARDNFLWYSSDTPGGQGCTSRSWSSVLKRGVTEPSAPKGKSAPTDVGEEKSGV